MAKVIVITGAGEGLGKALARRFSADGEKVVLLGRTLSKLETAASEFDGECLPVACDIGDPDSVRSAFETIAKSHDRIDVLINNAAVYAPFELFEAGDDEVMAQVVTNVAGPIFTTREALKSMGEGSHIINVTSETVDIKIPMMWLYAGTKTALERIGEGWAHELKNKGIRVTAVRAGKMYGEGKGSSGWDPEVTLRFAQACAEVGMPMMEQPLTDYSSIPDVFRMVVDAPADLNLNHITLGGRRPS